LSGIVGSGVISLKTQVLAQSAPFLYWPVPSNKNVACGWGCYSGHVGTDIVQQLIIQIADKEKAQMLLKLISALDFVNSVEVIEDNTNISDDEQDFFSLAGIWENRNITTESIRQEAWRQETK
jgi:hypothetical protein